jgi:nicotinamide riboside kinase
VKVNWLLGIAFTGSEGSGKTTLINALADVLQVAKTTNVVREAVKEMGLDKPPAFGTNKQLTMDFQSWLLKKRMVREKFILEPFLADRSSIDMFSYTLSHLAREDDMQHFLNEYYIQCIDYARTMYEFHFFVPSGRIPLVADGLRNTQPNNARLMHFIMLGMLQEHAIPHHVIQSVTLQDRIDEVLQVMGEHGLIK